MALVACRCPHCGGEVQIDDTLTRGFCMYCGTEIINDNAVVGHVTVDKSTELNNTLVLTKALLEVQNWKEAKGKVEEILTIDVNCSDAWYMKALLSRVDQDEVAYNKFVEKGDKCLSNSYHVFTKEDIDACFGIPVVFITECPSNYPNLVFETTIDQTLYEINKKQTIGLSKGTHHISCYAKSGTGKSAKPVDITIDVNGPCTYLLDLNMWSFTAKTRITKQ